MSRGKRAWLTSWVPHRLELYLSPSWRLAPVPLRRGLERLEIEHLRHGGQNNGDLNVGFGQFEKAGISRRSITPMLELGATLGLIETIRPVDPLGDIRGANAYRLTYLPAKGQSAPTDEWKRVDEAKAEQAVEVFRDKERAYQSRRADRRRAAA